MKNLEEFLRSQGYTLIAGVDEAGRGAIAGPVFASAVIFPPDFFSRKVSQKLKDSKELSPEKREKLFEVICKSALCYAIAYIDVKDINQIGIFKATYRAMYMALMNLKVKPELVLVDGPYPIPEYKGLQKTVIDGDKLCPTISAASILAKVSRDRYMKKLDKEYPAYGFAKHKGYATVEHKNALKKFGISPCHRSYYPSLKNLKIFKNV